MAWGTQTSRTLWLPLALVALAGCGPSEEVQQQLDQLAVITAEKDSLFNEVVENARLMNEINTELDKIEGLEQEAAAATASAESPVHASREALLAKTREVTERLQASEQRLASSQRRLRALGEESEQLKTRVAELEKNVADFQEVIESQKTTIAQLTEQVEMLETQNLALQDTITTLAEKENTVFYVVGTRRELIERGIIEEEGGARFLFIFGRRGETLVPAHDLDPTLFTRIDKRQVTEIPLPDTTAAYRIASHQNVEYLMTPPDDRGRIQGDTLRIADSEQFWMPSKFLILVKA